jgi:hypothetical protein
MAADRDRAGIMWRFLQQELPSSGGAAYEEPDALQTRTSLVLLLTT